nr:MAG TPA: hypothetical protein [Caudoviricetes sp.]
MRKPQGKIPWGVFFWKITKRRLQYLPMRGII